MIMIDNIMIMINNHSHILKHITVQPNYNLCLNIVEARVEILVLQHKTC